MVEYKFESVSVKARAWNPNTFYGNFKGIAGAKKYAAGLIQAGFDEVIIYRPTKQMMTYKSVGKVKRKGNGIYYTSDGLKFSPINMDGRKSKSRPVEWEV